MININWEREHTVIPLAVSIPILMVAYPEDSWMARDIDLEWVKFLANEENAASLTVAVEKVVIFRDAQSNELVAAIEKIRNSNIDVLTKQADLAALLITFSRALTNDRAVIFVYCGAHRKAALTLLVTDIQATQCSTSCSVS